MSENQHQQKIEPNGQHESLPLAVSQRRYPSLWLSCSDPVMDQALTVTHTVDSALIVRPLRSPTPERSLIDDVSLNLIETVVRNRRIVQIVVCGHADCLSVPKPATQVEPCSKSSYEKLLSGVCQREESNRQGQRHIVERIGELQSSPLLALALSQRALTIHGLFYLAEGGAFTVFDYQSGQFVTADF
jgi:carbonic anhydrase